MTTIKTTIKKEIGTIKLPKDIKCSLQYDILRLSTYPDITHFFKNDIIILEIQKILTNYPTVALDNFNLGLPVNVSVKITECLNFNRWTFYEEVEKEIEITSYEQGCYILSDIFTPLG